jgi:tRNA1Val (adenine37-N6)-methyltransferase
MFPDKNSPAVGDPNSTKRSDETLDTLFQGEIKLYQDCNGYRFSLDALLLADFLICHDGEQIADLGAGNGVIALILARLHPLLWITGVELQPKMVDRANRNIRMNACADKVTMRQADVRYLQETFAPGSFAAVVCNPPYRRVGSGRISPNAEKKIARHEITAGLVDFLRAGGYVLPIKGRMALIYPALRIVDLLQCMRNANLEPKRLRMVHSFADAEASLVLVEGVKGGRSGVKVLSPLFVYTEGNQYTSEVEGILAGNSATIRLSRAE